LVILGELKAEKSFLTGFRQAGQATNGGADIGRRNVKRPPHGAHVPWQSSYSYTGTGPSSVRKPGTQPPNFPPPRRRCRDPPKKTRPLDWADGHLRKDDGPEICRSPLETARPVTPQHTTANTDFQLWPIRWRPLETSTVAPLPQCHYPLHPTSQAGPAARPAS